MADTEPVPEKAPTESSVSEDDQRAAAATANRKRTLVDWEEKKKLWLKMGVPPALPAKK
jgi:hypothetical protein